MWTKAKDIKEGDRFRFLGSDVTVNRLENPSALELEGGIIGYVFDDEDDLRVALSNKTSFYVVNR